MEDFKGMARSTARSKTPQMKWEFARNILLSKGYTSIANEDGFDYQHEVPGEVVGVISTNDEIVYLSTDGEFSYIGLFKTNVPNAPNSRYELKLKTIYLGFKIDRPIEGVFFYNFKKELIIAFCDGIFEDSNIPKLINLTNIGVPLTPQLELVNPDNITQLYLTPQALEGNIEVTYETPGTLTADVVYVTYAYVLGDGISTTSYFSPHEIVYPTYNFRNEDKRNLIISLSNLDTSYSKIRIGLVVLSDNGLIGYVSNSIPTQGSTATVKVSSLEVYTQETVDKLVVNQVVYSRAKTMTVINDQLVIGNLVKTDDIKFQKYANMLDLGLWYGLRNKDKSNEALLCPDEVYSFNISLHYLDGTYSKEFHVPGNPTRVGTGDLDDLYNTDLIAMGLDDLIPNLPLKQFHIKNSGEYKINTMPCNPLDITQRELHWGYWENEEEYPINDEYDSTIGYDGITSLPGEDLRGNKIRYHRVPGLDAIVEKLPSSLAIKRGNDANNLTETITTTGLMPSFEVNVLNFDSVVPQEIKNQIQGFKLSIAKRIKGDTLVEDINFASPHIVQELTGFHLEYDTDFVSPQDELLETQFGRCHVKSVQLATYKQSIVARLAKFNYAIRERSPAYGGGISSALPPILYGRDPLPVKDITLPATLSSFVTIAEPEPYTFIIANNTQRYAYIGSTKYLLGNNIADNSFLDVESVKVEFINKLSPLSTGANTTAGTQNTPPINYWNPLGLTHVNVDNGSYSIKDYNASTGLYDTVIVNSDNRPAIGTFRACVTFLLVNKNIYTGFKPSSYITIGRATLDNTTKRFVSGGDVFTNNAYNVLALRRTNRGISSSPNYLDTFALYYGQSIMLSNISVTNNAEVYSKFSQVNLGVFYELGSSEGGDRDITEVYGADTSHSLYNRESFRLLNDLIVGIPFDVNNNDTTIFPFRVQRSLKQGNESLETNNIRTFLADNYKEMLNDRGEIIALRGSNKTLYIQQKYSLFVASIKDTLNTGTETTYLGEGDIFDRQPDEVMSGSNRGYVGCTSQFAAIVYKEGYVVVDQTRGKIFSVGGKGVKEISNVDMGIWFNENADTSLEYYTLDLQGNKQRLDNPYTQVGHLIGYDDKYRRLLFTKKMYQFLFSTDATEYTFDGSWYYKDAVRLSYNDSHYFKELSYTFSYDVDYDVWVCEHDYYPNAYIQSNIGLYTIQNKVSLDLVVSYNSSIFRHNSALNKGLFYRKTYDSYVDLLFNTRLDLKKLYQAWSWITEVEKADGSHEYFKTIDAIMVYNDTQCSGVVNLNSNNLELMRNTENEWNYNNFRDIVVDSKLPIIDNKGVVVASNLAPNRSWFNKGNFINTFIAVRMIMNNTENNTVYIHIVNVKSRTSDR